MAFSDGFKRSSVTQTKLCGAVQPFSMENNSDTAGLAQRSRTAISQIGNLSPIKGAISSAHKLSFVTAFRTKLDPNSQQNEADIISTSAMLALGYAVPCTTARWRFVTPEDNDAEGENAVPDPLHEDFTHLRQVYYETDPDYQARFSVPVLYDKIQKKIVNNESSEILRMFGTEFDDIIDPKYRGVSLYPEALQSQIDEVQAWHYDDINNGVYKCGIASTQEAYEHAVTELFGALDKVESHFSSTGGPYWFGQSLTEVDIRLYVTMIRFDPVYVQHFKCNIRDIRSGYPHIHKWLRNLYWNIPAFKETTNFHHIKNHYTKSHTPINPYAITPVGPLPHILPLDKEVAAVEVAAQL
ncbi:hypothetical protein ACSS6W_007851 [Trichoderma asperelloides]